MLLWHVAASVGFIRYAFRDPSMDLRFLALGAVLADVIDLPLGIAMWDRFEHVRLVAHSLPFAIVVMVGVLVFTRRGPIRKKWILLAVGLLLHLALDAMWASPETLWWPFLGWEFAPSGFATFGAYAADVLADPWMWAGEAAGLVYLAYLWRASSLRDASARVTLLQKGTVSAPIGRT